MDGDFWHSNEDERYFPIYPVQKRNKINDKRKNNF